MESTLSPREVGCNGRGVRSGRDPDCPRHRICARPEQEGRFALPRHGFGRDVIALVGARRHAEHRSVPEIPAALVRRGVPIGVRSVANLPDRYDELRTLALSDVERLRRVTAAAGQVALAIDGLQPDVGPEALGVLRDVLSGEILRAKGLLSSTQDDLAKLIDAVKEALEVPIAGVISAGQGSIRTAVKQALDGVPHQLGQFHYLREAAQPIDEADRHAKVQLAKQVRGVRPIEREVEGRDDTDARAIRGYGAAVRSALTDDGRAPLVASGLKLQDRRSQVAASRDRVGGRRGCRRD